MKLFRVLLMVVALGVLAACDEASPSAGGQTPTPSPQPPSAASEELRKYYAGVQRDLLTRGLMRTDGGGPDTPYTPAMLARNFENIVFFNEYAREGSSQGSDDRSATLRRWNQPVKIKLEFGPSVPAEQRELDRQTVEALVARLASTTGHEIVLTTGPANFHVLVMGHDDQATLQARIARLLPRATATTRQLFLDPPRDFYCFVVAYSPSDVRRDYSKAVALIRPEHPDLLRKSCYHEEIAQGLGLPNDSPYARPSIFNDDDEFALLTTHDEALLSMLYDPRLSIGMTLDEARPVIHLMAREKAGRLY